MSASVSPFHSPSNFPEHAVDQAISAFELEENGQMIPTIAPHRIMTGGHTTRNVEKAFVGAVLADCVRIERHLLNGGFGRGWKGIFTDPKTGNTSAMFVKTLGVFETDPMADDSDRRTKLWREVEEKARKEAGIYMHPWFTTAVDHPGMASARLCYGSVKFPESNGSLSESHGNIFFICINPSLLAHMNSCSYYSYTTNVYILVNFDT